MDHSPVLRWLEERALPAPGSGGIRCMLRFRSAADFRRFAREWRERHPPGRQASAAVRLLPLVHGVSFTLPAGRPIGSPWAGCAIEPDVRARVHGTVRSVPAVEQGIPWGVRQIRAPQAWRLTTGHNIKVGVIDTGIDFGHPDLRHSVSRGINLLARSMLPHDDNGHGTHIAGTIAAANQLYGMVGVAPRAVIHPVKAFDHNGSAYVSDIILGIEWCIRNRMDIINMSFGMKTRSRALLAAVQNARRSGIVIVASSGNDAKRKSIDYPARFPQTVSVGATTRMRRIAPFSNRGSLIDIYAPGDKIVSAWLRGKYNEMSGTSMATSHVSGAIALLLAYRPGLGPAEIKEILRRSTQPLRGRNAPKGAGEIDVLRMLAAADRL